MNPHIIQSFKWQWHKIKIKENILSKVTKIIYKNLSIFLNILEMHLINFHFSIKLICTQPILINNSVHLNFKIKLSTFITIFNYFNLKSFQ